MHDTVEHHWYVEQNTWTVKGKFYFIIDDGKHGNDVASYGKVEDHLQSIEQEDAFLINFTSTFSFSNSVDEFANTFEHLV